MLMNAREKNITGDSVVSHTHLNTGTLEKLLVRRSCVYLYVRACVHLFGRRKLLLNYHFGNHKMLDVIPPYFDRQRLSLKMCYRHAWHFLLWSVNV